MVECDGKTKAIAYYRVSTQKQGQSGLGLAAQQRAVEKHAEANTLYIEESFVEVETGTRKRQRPQIQKAIATAKEHDAILLIAKLDRLARNVAFTSALMESGVRFVAVDTPHVDNFTIHILAAVAEKEAKQIGQRTRDALQAAKARGTKLGTPANLTDSARERSVVVRRQQAIDRIRPIANYVQLMREAGQSYRQIAAQLNADGHRTAKGALFRPMTVKRVVDKKG